MTTQQIIDDVMLREGWPTYTNRASDRGGPTKGGITLATLEAHRKRRCSIKELQELSDAEAQTIYRTRYVDRYTTVPHAKLRAFLVDYAVTSWHDDSIRALQSGLRSVGTYRGAIDGLWGAQTSAAIFHTQSTQWATVFTVAVEHRVQKFFREAYDDDVITFLAHHEATQLHNLRGWILRRICPFV